MKTAKQKTGHNGEELAEKYLISQGYSIRERNFRVGSLEADLICELNRELIVVEVKSRYSDVYGFPEMGVSYGKKKNLGRLADFYIEKVQWEGEIRFDIISICYADGAKIDHFRNAFFPGLY